MYDIFYNYNTHINTGIVISPATALYIYSTTHNPSIKSWKLVCAGFVHSTVVTALIYYIQTSIKLLRGSDIHSIPYVNQ